MSYNISIIGLGLIGGSIAKNLRGFKNCKVSAYDTNIDVLEIAKQEKVIDNYSLEEKAVVENADLIILCIYPKACINFIESNVDNIKNGAIITDVCGVKEYLVNQMQLILGEKAEFIGAHPMAGRETSGYISSTNSLFGNASFILTPNDKNSKKAIDLITNMARYIGCKNIITTTPKEHDKMISFTSQLMHVVAVGLCNNSLIETSAGFSAGSLRDCTRVGLINEKLWSELFLLNKDLLIETINEFEGSLEEIKNAISNGDEDELKRLMIKSTKQKTKWLMEN